MLDAGCWKVDVGYESSDARLHAERGLAAERPTPLWNPSDRHEPARSWELLWYGKPYSIKIALFWQFWGFDHMIKARAFIM
jgi:hypothetical protein